MSLYERVADACKSLIFNSSFLMLTDTEDLSENSEAFACLVEEANGKGAYIE